LRGLPHVAAHGPHASPWHTRSQRWKPHASAFPHGLPHDTRSEKHIRFGTSILPHAHILLVNTAHGGHGAGSSWHLCAIFGCPHGGGWRAQGYVQLIRVPQGIGGSRTVRPQWQIIYMQRNLGQATMETKAASRRTSSNELCRQGGQAPLWSGRSQKWFPHSSGLSHTKSQSCSPELSTSASIWAPTLAPACFLPLPFVTALVSPASGQHGRLHACLPQERNARHGRSHRVSSAAPARAW
jgi:hypothetical protein